MAVRGLDRPEDGALQHRPEEMAKPCSGTCSCSSAESAGFGDQTDFLVKTPEGLTPLRFLGAQVKVVLLPKSARSGARMSCSASTALSLECNAGSKTSLTNALHIRD